MALMKYTSRRFFRTANIHGLSRFSSLMNTVYRRYLAGRCRLTPSNPR